MVAKNCSQIAPQENTLGRHYSRFSPIRRFTSQQNQSLVRSENPKIAKNVVELAKFG